MNPVGQIQFNADHNSWGFRCEPHVSMRLKQVFPRINKYRHGLHVIKSTPEVDRDIEWFLSRYYLTISDADAERLRNGSQQHRDTLDLIHTLLAGRVEPLPFELAVDPRDYQRVPATIVLNTGRLLLADDVGTGKTVCAICLFTQSQTLPALVVTLTHLPLQWKAEINRFAPSLRVHILKKGQPYDLTVRGKFPFPDVIVTSYSKLRGWAETLAPLVNTVVFDEVQELRNDTSAKYQAARHIARKCRFRMGLSVGPQSMIELQGGVFDAGYIGTIQDAYSIISAANPPVPLSSGHEVISLQNIFARSFDGDQFVWKPVKSIIRHRCDRPTRIIKASGRELLATDDHSVFRVTATGEFEQTQTEHLRVGDVLPVDNGANWQVFEEREIDVPTLCGSVSKAQVVVDLTDINRRDLNLRAWQWQNFHREAKYGTRLPIDVFLKHRNTLPPPECVYVGRAKKSYRIASKIKLSQWAYVLGFFLGDGWIADSNRVCFAVESARANEFFNHLVSLPDVELDPKIRKMPGRSVEIRCSNRLWAVVLESAMGKKRCHEKTIPADWIITWPEEARRGLLRGLLDSDGSQGHRNNRRYFTTTSLSLAQSTIVLLKSLGIVGSLSIRMPHKGGQINGRQIIGARLSYTVNWSKYAEDGNNDGLKGHRRRFSTNQSSFWEVPVRRISADTERPEYVYDIEMEGHPSFTANGILVHNSATPIYNFGDEFHNVLSVLEPGCLGTYEEFRREWCESGERKPRISAPKAFGTYLRDQGLMLRRTRADVGRELPRCERIYHIIDADTEALSKVSRSCAELARLILQESPAEKGAKWQASEEFSNALRQATGIAKAPYVADFVRLLVESGESVVLFGWHREVYSIWLDRLKDLCPVMFTGSESATQKEASKQAFLKGESKVLIISLRAGAGLDGLQYVSRCVVIGELDWSPGVIEQNIGRVDRDGQTDPVLAYFLVAEEGADPTIASILGIKRMQLEPVRDPDQELVEKLTVDPQHVKRLAENYLAQIGGR